MLIFNPPYVPTEEQEGDIAQLEGNLSAAWAGGAVGMGTTEAVIKAAPVCRPLDQDAHDLLIRMSK